MSDRGYGEILQYIVESKYGVLNYVRLDRTPVSRAMGSFAPDGIDLYFSTGRGTAKVREMENNRRVSFYFEHDNQAPESWKSLLLIGDAHIVSPASPDYTPALTRLAAKSPRFKERVAKGDLESVVVYRIVTREVQFLDRGKGYGPPRTILVG